MSIRWSPHPRYRLYTGPASYGLPLRHFFRNSANDTEARGLLEAEICRRFDVQAAACVPMARIGLYFALQELIRPGQTVIMSPLTIIDVVNMVLLAGGIPVFADIRRHSCGIDPDQAESLIDGGTGAVLITHLHGETAGADDFRQICDRRGVRLIEDVAQAFGAAENGRRLGTIGDVGIYSFGFYKNINAWRGGMLVSHDEDLIGRIRLRIRSLPRLAALRVLGLSALGVLTDVSTWPPLFATATHPVLRHAFLRELNWLNSLLDPEYRATRLSEVPSDYLLQMSPPQLMLALRHLNRVDADSLARIENADRYHDALAGLEMLITPRKHNGLSHIYTYYPIQCRERGALLRYAMQHKRDFAAQHLRNCADLPEFTELHRDCPNARAAAQELILLPTYPRYPAVEIHRNIEVIHEFSKSAGKRLPFRETQSCRGL